MYFAQCEIHKGEEEEKKRREYSKLKSSKKYKVDMGRDVRHKAENSIFF